MCTRYGCEVDAKASDVNVHIPAGLKTGNWEVPAGRKALGVNIADNGLATGIIYVDQKTGEVHQQPADLILMTAYTLTNVRMLLLSTNNAHPNGIGNDRSMVEELHLPDHHVAGERRVRGRAVQPVHGQWRGPEPDLRIQRRRFRPLQARLHRRRLDLCRLRPARPPHLDAQSALDQQRRRDSAAEDADAGAATIASEVASVAGKGYQWGQAWKENLRQRWDSIFSIGIQGEVQADNDNFLDLDPVYEDAGACRCCASPSTSMTTS